MSSINKTTYAERLAADMKRLLGRDDPALVRLHTQGGTLEGHLVGGEADRLTLVDQHGTANHVNSRAVVAHCVVGEGV